MAVATIKKVVRRPRRKAEVTSTPSEVENGPHPATPPDFDEAFYLSTYLDVAAAVSRGEVRSAADHFVQYGRGEGRASCAPPPSDGAGRAWGPRAAAAAQCPACHALGPIPALVEDRGHVLHRCPVCRACFYADRTVPDYEEEVQAPFYQRLYLEQNGSIHHTTRTLFLLEPDGIDSVLDVGCGFGFGVDMAARTLGWRAVGIDPSHYGREGARLLGADIRKDYLTAESALGEPFGLVVASEVIEHVPDPDAFLLLLRRWMRPGGVLVITTPDAEAIAEGVDEAVLVSILAVGTHLVLFTAAALEIALLRAGFGHVAVERHGNGLTAMASEVPLRRIGAGDERHIQAYQAYLEHLFATLEPGSPLWNGAAGRLMQLQVGALPDAALHARFARVAEVWRERFGIDLARLRLPEVTDESEIAAVGDVEAGKALMWRRLEGVPFNLATVLFCRARLEAGRAGRLPEEVLRWARPAYVHAVHTARVLALGTMIDLDLRQTAGRARLMIVEMLVELAPEMEGVLLGIAGAFERSP